TPFQPTPSRRFGHAPKGSAATRGSVACALGYQSTAQLAKRPPHAVVAELVGAGDIKSFSFTGARDRVPPSAFWVSALATTYNAELRPLPSQFHASSVSLHLLYHQCIW